MKHQLRKVIQVCAVVPVIFFRVFNTAVLAIQKDPHRIREVEDWVANGILILWSLSIPYFLFTIITVGFQYMTAFGDEQKLAQIKTKGGNIMIGFALVFGGYFVVRIVLDIVMFKNPDQCFSTPITSPFFQIFFPSSCSFDPLVNTT